MVRYCYNVSRARRKRRERLTQMRCWRFLPCRPRFFNGEVELDLGTVLENPGYHLDGDSNLQLFCRDRIARPRHESSPLFQLHDYYSVWGNVFKARWRRRDSGVSEDLALAAIFLEFELSRQTLWAIGTGRKSGVAAIFAHRAHHAAVLEVHSEIRNLSVGYKTDFSKPTEHKSIPPEKMDKGVLADAAHVVRETDVRIGYLALPGFPAQLLDNFVGHGNPRGPNRMAFGFEAAVHIHGHLAPDVGPFLFDELAAVTFFAESEVFIGHDLGNGEAVVDLGDLDVFWRDLGHAVSLFAGFHGRRQAHQMGAAQNGHARRRTAHAVQPDHFFAQGLGQALLGQNHAGGPIRVGATVVDAEWRGHRGRVHRLVQLDLFSEKGVGVFSAVKMVFDGHLHHLLVRCAELVHVVGGEHRVVTGKGAAKNGFPLHLADTTHQGEDFGGGEFRHLLAADDGHDLMQPGLDRHPGRTDGGGTRGAGHFSQQGRLGIEIEIFLDHTGHRALFVVLRDRGNDRGIQFFTADSCILDRQAESLEGQFLDRGIAPAAKDSGPRPNDSNSTHVFLLFPVPQNASRVSPGMNVVNFLEG